MIPLSNSATRGVAKALASDLVSYIEKDERYVDFLQELVAEFLKEKLGVNVAESDNYELAMAMMDAIQLAPSRVGG